MDTNILTTIIKRFLEEDISRGDITTESIFLPDQLGSEEYVAREVLIAAGISTVAPLVFAIQNPQTQTEILVTDGASVKKGQTLLTISGPVTDMLKAERVALNLVQRMCGIATFTRQFVDKVADLSVKITDTRKTTPGLRIFEKYAVRCGGGSNHRYNLSDGVLIKDNHIAACGSITNAVEKVRQVIPHTIKIEVETDTIEQVCECIDCGVDIIMLDKMDIATMREAVNIIEDKAIIEASGNVSLKTVETIAQCGVDIVSIGALTHSAPSCDIGMDWDS